MAAVGVTAVLVASCLRLGSPVGFLLATYIVASAELVSVSLLLSTRHWLTRGGLVAALSLVLLGAVASWLLLGRPSPPPVRAALTELRDALRDPIVALFAGLTAVSQAYLLAVSLTVPQSLPDTMLYHLPRSALWKQQHAVSYIADVPKEAVNVFPPNAEIEATATMILSGGDRYVGLVQLVALAFACVAIAGVARRLGFDPRAAVFAGLAYSTFTVVMLQTSTALNDLVVASLLIACVYFALGSAHGELALGALALALALGTKLTTVLALPALALVVFASQPLRRWALIAVYGAAGIVAGSVWLVVNRFETGTFDGGVSLEPGGSAFDRILRSFLDLLEMSNLDSTGLLISPLWGVPALLLGLVVAAVLCRRRRWLAAALAGLAGVFAYVSLPLLVTWAHVGVHALRAARVAIGLGGESGQRLPAGYYESAMYSSYGLAFIVLFLGSCALVGADVAKRRSSPGVAAALVGVPLTVLIGAIAMVFDPQHLRYWAFPVALATSVFGVTLRMRAVTWMAGALAAVTVVISLAYFVPRPWGLVLLSNNRGADHTARWFVQAESGQGDSDAFRFLEERIPDDATIALDLGDDTYIYPAWDAGLRRIIRFVPRNGAVPEDADWLVVGPFQDVDKSELAEAGWKLELASPRQWRIYGR
jgi:hypothetical protein